MYVVSLTVAARAMVKQKTRRTLKNRRLGGLGTRKVKRVNMLWPPAFGFRRESDGSRRRRKRQTGSHYINAQRSNISTWHISISYKIKTTKIIFNCREKIFDCRQVYSLAGRHVVGDHGALTDAPGQPQISLTGFTSCGGRCSRAVAARLRSIST